MSDAAATHVRKLDALSALASEPSSERRRELLREVTDVFFSPTPPPPRAMELFEAALERMTAVMEAELRADLAERIAPLTVAPRRLVSRLIADGEGAVAAPILERSRALTHDDLMGVVSTGGQLHLRAVSRRADLTEILSDKIVERGDDDTLNVLVSNAAAPLSRAASETVVDRAMANPGLHAAVVGRQSLPIDLLNQMYLLVEQRLREKIVARNATVDPALLDAALEAARSKVAVAAGVLPPDYASSAAYVDKLAADGPLAPQTLVGFLRSKQLTRFLVALSKSADVDFSTAQRVVERRDGEAMTLLCRTAGWSADLFRDVLVLLRMGDQQAIAVLSARFDCLPRETASRVVRFWKLRQTASMPAAA